MTINADVMSSILAMDAYHRGGSRLDLQGDTIGKATIGVNSIVAKIVGSSFFAQSYTMDGKTIMSYRGTDNLLADPFTGWFIGAGAYRQPQALMAAGPWGGR